MRVLVCGTVNGKYKSIFKRVSAIHEKNGPFDLLICVGDFFGNPPAALGEEIVSPIPTLILGPVSSEQAKIYPSDTGSETSRNFIFLGKRGVYHAANGLQIAYLSGYEQLPEGETNKDATFSAIDIESLKGTLLKSDYKGIDLLITHTWPYGVDNFTAFKPENWDPKKCSTMLSSAVKALMPRYHFAGQFDSTFYERAPFRNHRVLAESDRHVTRFIGLAALGNPKKARNFYAFSVEPMSTLDKAILNQQPADVTENPFKNVIPEQGAQKTRQDVPTNQFFFSEASQSSNDRKRRSTGKDGGKPKRVQQGPCWFCLSSPEVEKHLVVSIGSSAYLALSKGGLTDDHVLVLPVGHHASSVSSPPDVYAEVERFKKALVNFFKTKGKVVVFFERNFRSHHLQIQCVPVPADKKMDLKEAFMLGAEEDGVELNEIPEHSDMRQIIRGDQPFFHAELPSGERLLCRIKGRFSLHFGREVLARPNILNLPERIDWKDCKSSTSQEKELARSFRDEFKPFDFTLI